MFRLWKTHSDLKDELQQSAELCRQLQSHNCRLSATIEEQTETIAELLSELKDLKEQLP